MWRLSTAQEKELRKLKIRAYDKDLRYLSADELRHQFGAKSSGRIMVRVLVRNLLYQAASWIKQGKAEKIEGNMRSLYYQWVKPVVQRLPEVKARKRDASKVMSDELERLVVGLRLFKYRDLELVDERWEDRWLSDGRNPHLLLYAEKSGFVMFLQEQWRRYGIHAVALGGFPSHLSSEYLVEQMRGMFGEVPRLVLLGIVDWDPSGELISRSFEEQLCHHGVEIEQRYSLIQPELYTERELRLLSYEVPSKYKVRVERWLERGGGIDGQPRGMESDSLPKSRLRKALSEALGPHLQG